MEEPASEDQRLYEIRKKTAQGLKYTHAVFWPGASLMALEPNEDGLYLEMPYEGGPFDSSEFRLIEEGWDHTHCCLCTVRIDQGDSWWSALPPSTVGLCEECYDQLFPEHQ
jgi:hypothetical protein